MNILARKLLFKDNMTVFFRLSTLCLFIFFTFSAKTQNVQYDTINRSNIDTLNLISSPLNEVVVTGQIHQSGLFESVNSFLLISNKDIQDNASNNLADILSYQALFDLDFACFRKKKTQNPTKPRTYSPGYYVL